MINNKQILDLGLTPTDVSCPPLSSLPSIFSGTASTDNFISAYFTAQARCRDSRARAVKEQEQEMLAKGLECVKVSGCVFSVKITSQDICKLDSCTYTSPPDNSGVPQQQVCNYPSTSITPGPNNSPAPSITGPGTCSSVNAPNPPLPSGWECSFSTNPQGVYDIDDYGCKGPTQVEPK